MKIEAERLKDKTKISEAMIYQGLSYGYLNEFDEEKEYYKAALKYSLDNQDSVGMAKAFLNLGVNKFYVGSLDSAAFYYEMALRVCEPMKDTKLIAMSLNNLGQVYSRLDKYEEAKSAYENSLKYKVAANDTSAIINTYFNLTSLSLSNKDYERAVFYSKETIGLAKFTSDSLDLGGAYINLVLSLTNLDDGLEEALDYMELVLKYRPAFKSEELLLDLHSAAADLYRKSNQFTIADYHLSQMAKYLRTDAFPETQMKFYELSYEQEKRKGRYPEALAFLEKYQKVKDQYISESVQKNVTKLEKKYQAEQRELKITELELDQRSAALALANSNNQRNVFISAFILFFIAAGFLLYRYQTNKKTSDLLAVKNGQITTALEEREILLKEIHHRVKNNLQVISSLLNLQAGSLENEVAIDAVRDGQYRVKSMALIHQKLYSTDDVRGVNVQEYLEQLTVELFRAFGVNQDTTHARIDTNGLKMDIDTVIPLGLILNELITNSIKYAFQEVENGILEISIKEVNDHLNVMVKDNGSGMDAEAMKTSNSFGWKMIHSLSRKLKAEISVHADSGTCVQMIISRYKLVQ